MYSLHSSEKKQRTNAGSTCGESNSANVATRFVAKTKQFGAVYAKLESVTRKRRHASYNTAMWHKFAHLMSAHENY